VCVNPVHVAAAANHLRGSAVEVCTVVGFPLGNNLSRVKAYETHCAIEDGATEIDMVINTGALRGGEIESVHDDIAAVVKAAGGTLVKVILETCFLTDEQIVMGCEQSVQAGADFVKTSTGFGAFGATEKHVRLMRQTVGPDIGVKASGGMDNVREALRMIRAGASRLGVSASIPIVEGLAMARYNRGWMADEVPCRICPSRLAARGKVPKELWLVYKEKCRECPDREFNKFYE
jgi:deoxyribose-phosphate aldolase